MSQINGRGPLERVAREVETVLHAHAMREENLEPQLHIAQGKNIIAIEAETYHGETYIVTVATGRPPAPLS